MILNDFDDFVIFFAALCAILDVLKIHDHYQKLYH